MKAPVKIALGILIALGAAVFFRSLIGGSVVALLAPAGQIASQERDVIVKTVLIMLIAAVPMLVLCFLFAWRYRAGNRKAAYDPERTAGVWGQLAIWAIPAAIVAVLWGIVWSSAHALDPFKPIASSKSPLTIQVVALEWKWLFIYPEQDVATVGYVEFPADTPIHFELTADAPMSNFWIPQLGSQMYAMASMMTQLNLIAAKPGEYAGRNTEINGEGYADMTFTAKAVPRPEFDDWVRKTKSSGALDAAAYAALAVPSREDPPASYSSVEPGLFDTIMMKYMKPAPEGSMPGM